MSRFNPTPQEEAVEGVREQWKERSDTFSRVYYTALGVRRYTHYSKIADTANCSANSAKKHLERLVEMGLVSRDPNVDTARYRRNDAYFEWLEANRIAEEMDKEEICSRVEKLEARQENLADQFDKDDPASVGLPNESDHETVHERLTTVSEWQSVGQAIQLYELAFRLSCNDGHLISN